MNKITTKIIKKNSLIHQYTFVEEVAHCGIHAPGFFLSIWGLTSLLSLEKVRNDQWMLIGCLLYGVSLILLYLSSTLYHALPYPKAKRIFKILDHCCIFLLIVGTFTPLILAYQRNFSGLATLGTMWTLALVGIVLKIFYSGKYRLLSTFIYLGMGWLPFLVAQEALRGLILSGGWVLILAGGLSYSLGTIFYMVKKIPFHHAIWHLFVLGGSLCHYFAIRFYIIA